jgi:hypothetical protein
MPLFDIERFRRHIEALRMWEVHQRGEEPRTLASRRILHDDEDAENPLEEGPVRRLRLSPSGWSGSLLRNRHSVKARVIRAGDKYEAACEPHRIELSRHHRNERRHLDSRSDGNQASAWDQFFPSHLNQWDGVDCLDFDALALSTVRGRLRLPGEHDNQSANSGRFFNCSIDLSFRVVAIARRMRRPARIT